MAFPKGSLKGVLRLSHLKSLWMERIVAIGPSLGYLLMAAEVSIHACLYILFMTGSLNHMTWFLSALGDLQILPECSAFGLLNLDDSISVDRAWPP